MHGRWRLRGRQRRFRIRVPCCPSWLLNKTGFSYGSKQNVIRIRTTLACATLAMRMKAQSLANSEERSERDEAVELYRCIADTELAEFSDAANLSILLADRGNNDEAKEVVLGGLKKFPDKREYFSQIGQRIVEATGDKDFRRQLEAEIAERNYGE